MNDKWLAWMNSWELTNEENGWDEVSTNHVNFNIHFPIFAILVLKIKHAEECAIILRVLCWHRYIRESSVQNVREQRSSKHLKNVIKPSTDLDGNECVISVLVILLFPVLRIQNFNLLVDFVDTIHSPARPPPRFLPPTCSFSHLPPPTPTPTRARTPEPRVVPHLRTPTHARLCAPAHAHARPRKNYWWKMTESLKQKLPSRCSVQQKSKKWLTKSKNDWVIVAKNNWVTKAKMAESL
jgi:hypothetical protein